MLWIDTLLTSLAHSTERMAKVSQLTCLLGVLVSFCLTSEMCAEPTDVVWTKYKSDLLELGPPEIYIYSTNASKNIPSRIFPEVGNGHVATQIGNKWMFMNGLFNEHGTDSHRAAIPSTVNWNVKSADENDRVLNQTYTLNAAVGVFIESKSFKDFDVEVLTYVTRMRQHLLVREVWVRMHDTTETVILKSEQLTDGFHSPDISLITTWEDNVFKVDGFTKIPETNTSGNSPVYIIGDAVPNTLIFTKAMNRSIFLTSIGTEKDEVLKAYYTGRGETSDILLNEQVFGWMFLWKEGRIYPTGDLYLSQVTHACQYYILSSLPWPGWKYKSSWPFFGVSPGGLAHGIEEQDYQGHVFWDMETWIYPTFLLIHPLLAEQMMNYRFYTLSAAVKRAKSEGYQGARYPWESAFTGFETSPWDLSANNEIHVIGDISFGLQQFLWMKASNDTSWYHEKGKLILEEIARYWYSRLVYNSHRDEYEIHGVMPPDEFVHQANNSVYTNAVARLSLQAPYKFSNRYQLAPSEEYVKWYNVSEKILMPADTQRQIFLEHDTYKLGSHVKQADVVLLQYPLQYPMPLVYQKNDLEYYENVTDPNGPAMTWAMFAVGWLTLMEPEKAWDLFKRSFDYVRPPFLIWTEVRTGAGAVNFHTGMGGFLQSLVNGYGGVRIEEDELQMNPALPPGTSTLQMTGIKYQGRACNVTIYENKTVSVTLTKGPPLTVKGLKDAKTYTLTASNPTVLLKWQKLTLKSEPA